MPYSAVLLGIAGLIPFLFLPLSYVFNWLSLTQSALYFIQYSAVLLSFFWGCSLVGRDKRASVQ